MTHLITYNYKTHSKLYCKLDCILIELGGDRVKFEWDESKEKTNIGKHGIDFTTAALVFNDINRIEAYDVEHSIFEDRYRTIGRIADTVIIVAVSYTERLDAIRIISARIADKREEREYYDRKGN